MAVKPAIRSVTRYVPRPRGFSEYEPCGLVFPPATFVQLPAVERSREMGAPITGSRKRSTTLPLTTCPRWAARAETIFGGRLPWRETPAMARNAWPRFQVGAANEPL